MFHRDYKNLENLPEVKELIKVFKSKGYELWDCSSNGLRMQKYFTEIHLIPEYNRLRFLIHDDGMGEDNTNIAWNLGKDIVLKYGYRQGVNILDSNNGFIEHESEFYKIL